MPTFVYYKPTFTKSVSKNIFGYTATFLATVATFYGFTYLDEEQTKPMKNKTMKYFNYHEEIAKVKDRPTFYRPPSTNN